MDASTRRGQLSELERNRLAPGVPCLSSLSDARYQPRTCRKVYCRDSLSSRHCHAFETQEREPCRCVLTCQRASSPRGQPGATVGASHCVTAARPVRAGRDGGPSSMDRVPQRTIQPSPYWGAGASVPLVPGQRRREHVSQHVVDKASGRNVPASVESLFAGQAVVERFRVVLVGSLDPASCMRAPSDIPRPPLRTRSPPPQRRLVATIPRGVAANGSAVLAVRTRGG